MTEPARADHPSDDARTMVSAALAKVLQRQPPAAAGRASYDAGDVLAEQVIRIAIEVYFAE